MDMLNMAEHMYVCIFPPFITCLEYIYIYLYVCINMLQHLLGGGMRKHPPTLIAQHSCKMITTKDICCCSIYSGK